MYGEQETNFQCPYCGETISMLFEVQYGSQSYIEDCEVCCRPIELKFETDGESVTSIQAKRG